MLKSLRFENFQIWKELYLEFIPGINAIIGPSDRGKSSILRGLYWLAMNAPSGDTFIRHGAKHCLVEGKFNEHTIQRFRSNKENKYIIDGTVFSTVGTGVPREVKEIMGLTDTNFQMQDDPFFLIGLPNAGEVAKKLNQVVGLNLIDTSVSYPDKIIRKMNNKIKFYESELKDKKKELRKFKNLDKIIRLSKKLEKDEEEIQEVNNSINVLNDYIEDLIFRHSEIKRYAHIEKINKKLSLMSKFQKEREKLDVKMERLQIIIKEIQQNKKFVTLRKNIHKKLEKLGQELNKQITFWSNNKIRVKQLKETINIISDGIFYLSKKDKELKIAETRFNTQKKDLEICPLCGSLFKEGK